jgi:small-conductance mechanosensitive channel
VKFGIILFAVVVAYPYIPGSGTAAFQGVTIFLGVLLSFGSSSVISNLLAGLFVIYRRSVNLGDLIGIGGVIGRIEAVNLLETDLRTPKNELVSVPNSQLLGSQLTNYTRYGNGGGLIVHSTVGIGYEEPQRKIEAMLIEAARRTRGVESDPMPFVLRTALADFAVNYEINAYARHVDALPKLQSDLNANILDVFNERKVQIMTPAYERDPEEPKIAPMDESDADGVPRNK